MLAAIAHPGTNHPIVFRVRLTPSTSADVLPSSYVAPASWRRPPPHGHMATDAVTVQLKPCWRPCMSATLCKLLSDGPTVLNPNAGQVAAVQSRFMVRHLSLYVQIMWALCVYLEAVSVLPQLRMMQGAKVVEKFTAHYVFALGLSRFVSCAHWILQACLLSWTQQHSSSRRSLPGGVANKKDPPWSHDALWWVPQILDGDSFLLKAMGSGLWPAMVLLSEIVQTFILADFWCVL